MTRAAFDPMPQRERDDRLGARTGSRGMRGRLFPLALILVVLVGFAFRHPVLVGVASFLEVGEEPVPADLIQVLGGNIASRPKVAADLYHAGYAPRLLLARVQDDQATLQGVFPNETDATRDLLLRLGVPDSAIVVVAPRGGAASTTDDARTLADYLRLHPAERVLVVTSAYHTRRARWNLRKQLRGIPVELRMISARDLRFSANDWWTNEDGLIIYPAEYLKMVHNRIYR